MRQSVLRRLLAALVLVVGLGAASSALPAQASTPHTHHVVAPMDDWHWGP